MALAIVTALRLALARGLHGALAIRRLQDAPALPSGAPPVSRPASLRAGASGGVALGSVCLVMGLAVPRGDEAAVTVGLAGAALPPAAGAALLVGAGRAERRRRAGVRIVRRIEPPFVLMAARTEHDRQRV